MCHLIVKATLEFIELAEISGEDGEADPLSPNASPRPIQSSQAFSELLLESD